MFLHVGKFVLYENTDHRGLYYAGLSEKKTIECIFLYKKIIMNEGPMN